MVALQPLFMQNDIADQVAHITRRYISDLIGGRGGIIQDTAFQVRQRALGANNSVDIQPGAIISPQNEFGGVGHFYYVNDRVLNVVMPSPAHSSLQRIDTIAIRARDSAFLSGGLLDPVRDDAIVEWVVGAAVSGTPTPPVLSDTVNYYKLANVFIAASTSSGNVITSPDITDLRTSPYTTVQGWATGIGGIITCTSVTRPATPRSGQCIWELDTKRFLINEGTSVAPAWVVYISGPAAWTNYTPQFPLIGTNTQYGRYLKVGTVVLGVAGFKLNGTSGDVQPNVNFFCRLPVPAKNGGVGAAGRYIGGGRAFDSTGIFQGVYWSATGEILQGTNVLTNFATAGTAAWRNNIPFNWGTGASSAAKADHFSTLFCYEAAS
jgi:hypothetical protein